MSSVYFYTMHLPAARSECEFSGIKILGVCAQDTVSSTGHREETARVEASLHIPRSEEGCKLNLTQRMGQ